MDRNLRSIIYQGAPGWSLQSFLKIATRVLEFIPDVDVSVYLTGGPPPLTSDDPQMVYSHRECLKWIEKQLSSGSYRVFHGAASPDAFERAAVWMYPTHLPESECSEVARLAQRYGAIPIFNPIGVLGEQVFAGVPIYGIPILDSMVRTRYAYEAIRLLSEPATQEMIRVPMMEYAWSEGRAESNAAD